MEGPPTTNSWRPRNADKLLLSSPNGEEADSEPERQERGRFWGYRRVDRDVHVVVTNFGTVASARVVSVDSKHRSPRDR